MLNIVLFGPPGAGKGTQSAKLVEKYNLIHLSTGDILRGEIAAGTILGQEAKILMDQGMLVPDDIVITMINNKLNKNPNAKGFIFDGFPRTTAQAQALDKLLTTKGTAINLTLALEVSTEELTKRLIQRGMESGRSDDQDEKTIRNRVAEYTNKTAPLKDYYSGQKKFRSVSGIGSIDEIFNALCSKIDPEYVPEIIPGIPAQPSMHTPVTQDTYQSIVERTPPPDPIAEPQPIVEKKVERSPVIEIITVKPAKQKTAKSLVKKKAAEKKTAAKKKKGSPKKKKAAKKKVVKKKVTPKKKKPAAKKKKKAVKKSRRK